MSNLEQSFISHFSKIEDPRTETKNKRHKLIDIVVISVCASIYQLESWESIAEFGRGKIEWFKTFLELPNGIPSHDTFRRLFLILKPEYFEAAFLCWTESFNLKSKGDIISLDGKTVRGSGSKSKGKKAIHLVNAWSCNNGLILGQKKIATKSNEITAIPELLDALSLKGSTVTIDAMGCQKNIAEKITDQGGRYVLALKGNQEIMHNEVKSFFDKSVENNFSETGYTYYQTDEKGHGRMETRCYYYVDSIDFLSQHTSWSGLKGIGMTQSHIIRDGKETYDKRYYLCSINGDAKAFANMVREHWKIENQLHWVLDVQYGEDLSQKGGNSGANFSMIRKLVINLLKRDKSSKKRNPQKRVQAMIDDNYLKKLLISA